MKSSAGKVVPFCVFIVCLGFVLFQGWNCIEKFFLHPQVTKISIERPRDQISPEISICPSYAAYLRPDILAGCGISTNDYSIRGNWAGNCTDPHVLHEMMMIPLTEIVSEIVYTFDDDVVQHYAVNVLNWTSSMTPHFGRCFTLKHPKNALEFGIIKIGIAYKQNATIFIHSAGIWRSPPSSVGYIQTDAILGIKQHLKISLDAFHLLDYLGEKCEPGDSYDYDDCNLGELDAELESIFGCKTPFTENATNTCTNATQGQLASEYFYKKIRNNKKISQNCYRPCSSLTIKPITTLNYAGGSTLTIEYPEAVTVTTSQYAYSGLSLVAEIGGYVGFFLGVSFNQLGDVLQLLVAKLYFNH